MGTSHAVSRANELDADGEARIYRSFRHFWHVVAYAQDLGEAPIGFTLCGQDIVVARMAGEVVAFDDLCAHRGTRLSLGRVLDGCELECPYHGWRYNAAGQVTLAPQRPDLASHLRASVRRYPATEALGMVWVCLADEPHFGLPEYPLLDDPAFHHVAARPDDWRCSAPRRVENFTDYGHLGFVHDGYLGDRDRPEVPGHDVYREENRLENAMKEGEWLSVPIAQDDSDPYAGQQAAAREDPYRRYALAWRVYMPLSIVLNVVFEDGDSYHALFHPTPIDATRIRNFTMVSRNFGDPDQGEAELGGFTSFIYEQDKPLVESQRPEELPEDLSAEMHLKGVDTYSIEYRRWLVELARELEGKPA